MPFAGSCLLCGHCPLFSPLPGFLLLRAVLSPLPVLLSHPGSHPPRLHFSSGDRPEQTLGQPGCAGWAVKDGEPCSGALRTPRCFKRSKMLLKSRSGFCLEPRRSNFPPSITAVIQVGVCCELKLRAETWGQQHPKIKSFRVSQVHFAFADLVSGAIHLPPPKSRPRSPGSFWMMVINSYCSLKPDHKFHSVIM